MIAPLASGTLLDDRYRIVGVARRGKYGQTYLARDQKQFNELCVLKEFVPSQQDPAIVATLLQLFHQEASTLYGLRHPQLPRPRAMIFEGQRFYWVREYVEGKSYGVLLNDRKANAQTFSEAEVMQLMAQLLPVLAYLHSRGVIHGNINPDSIILRQHDQLPILINYGLVRDLVARLQLHPISPEDAKGRWGYTPPEKANENKLYPSSDVYSLAVTAIVLLTGKNPEDLYNEKSQSFEWGQGGMGNPKFARVLRQMLDLRPPKRFASADQVLQALEPITNESLQPAETQPAATSLPIQPAAPPPSPKYSASSPSEVEPLTSPTPEPIPLPAEPEQPEAATVLQPDEAEAPPRPRRRVRRRPAGDPRASAAMVVGLALLIGVIGWKVLSSLRSHSPTPESSPSVVAGNPTVQSSSAPNPSTSATRPAPVPIAKSNPPKKPPAVKSTKPAKPLAADSSLRDRLRKLGVDNQVFTNITDDLFYAKYPQYKDQKAGGKTDQGKTRWNETASDLMDKLETLSPESRKKIGNYQRADYDKWLAALGEGDAKRSPTLDALADGRFFKWFPEQKGKTLNPRTTGQLWYAIAANLVDSAKAKKASQPKSSANPKSDDG